MAGSGRTRWLHPGYRRKAARHLPQRILVKHKTTVRVVSRCRIRTSSFRKGELLHPPSMQQPREAKISFDAARLGIKSVLRVALPGELLADGPGLRPHRRILDGHDVFKRGRGDTGPALDQMQVLPRALKIRLRTEVRHVDHERVALEAAARVAVPLAHIGRQVWTPIHDDVALPSLALTYVVEYRDAARRLYDPAKAACWADALRQ